MYRAIDLHCPDQIIHLGDIMDDAEKIARAYPKLPVCRVPGNCDGWTTAVPKKQIVLGGASILLAHGHQWGVKQSYDRAIADARAVHADLLLFGHTHKALCQQLELSCQTAQGEQNGEPHFWNVVQTAEGWRHIDLSGGEPALYTDAQLLELGYTWGEGALPACAEE